ncbi:MAG: dihydropteroate synthase [Magnetospirillum sp.]|nr:dihydropteroate synthase [Magnetospirillum sp.]
MPTIPTPAYRRSPALPRGLAWDEAAIAGRLYLMPAGIVAGERAAAAVVAGNGWPIAGGPLAFSSAAAVWREGAMAWLALAPFPEVVEWAQREGEPVASHVSRLVHRVGGRRKEWAGLPMDRPLVMGIVNATPDSFSDGGDTLAPATAVSAALAMAAAGADIVDVGGESTRPGAAPVSEDAELARVIPVIRALAEKGLTVSVDTRHARVMGAAVEAGARIVNDVAALRGPGALEAVAQGGAAVCLMHMRGEPGTMQQDPRYDCAPLDVFDFLAERVRACEEAGIPRGRIAVDPGIGFGKTVAHNAQILAALPLYHGLGCPVLLGASRKSFIAGLSAGEPPKARLPGSLAAALAGLEAGVQIVRVHDVAETVQAVRVMEAVRAAG